MTAVVTAVASGALLLAFVGLLHIEARRGDRVVLSRARFAFDRFVRSVSERFGRLHAHLGTGVFRIVCLRLFSRVLERLLSVNEVVATHLYRLLQRNRRTVRAVKRSAEKTHLDLIAEHQAAHTLNDAEREALKRRSIEGE